MTAAAPSASSPASIDVDRTFSLDDQRAFARLSGDANPLHVDPVAARRTLFGAPVVHGVHTLLWALDRCASISTGRRTLTRVRALFRRPAYLGRTIRLHAEVDADGLTATAHSGDGAVLQVTAGLADADIVGGEDVAGIDDLAASIETPLRDRGFDDAAAAAGALPLALDPALLASLLPSLGGWLPPVQIAEMLATTRLVGMETPGLHSLYVGLNLARPPGAQARQPAPALAYRVQQANRRYSTINLAVTGPTLAGTLETFFRPPPRPPLPMADAARAIGASELAGQRALVVGGSRGLGEATAKAIVAGGGLACITYHRGADEGARVARDLSEVRAGCAALPLDVAAPGDLAGRWPVDWKPTHLYYFATPFIRVDKATPFDSAAVIELLQTYVIGLHATIEAVCRLAPEGITVVAPSTIYLDSLEPGSTSYCIAKAAMEELGRHLPSIFPVQVAMPRLPRSATDQTASLIDASSEAPLTVAVAMLRGRS